MLKNLQTDDSAPWKQRFRAPIIVWTQVARGQRSRGLAVSNKSGKYQLYAWDVPTGNLRQLTDQPGGVLEGAIASDGHYVYYMNDQQGNEIGHYVRVAWEGGEPEDISPTSRPLSCPRPVFLSDKLCLGTNAHFHLFSLVWPVVLHCSEENIRTLEGASRLVHPTSAVIRLIRKGGDVP